MKTIKFRAWDKKRKYMWDWGWFDEMHIDTTDKPVEENRYGWIVRKLQMHSNYQLCELIKNKKEKEACENSDYFIVEDFILMQFTGFKDKKGKDIYEGDIIKFPFRKGFTNGLVEWGYVGWYVKCNSKVSDRNLSDVVYEDMDFNCEVIGNIYENPNLLKV